MAIDNDGTPVYLAQGGSGNVATNSEDSLRRSLARAMEGVPNVEAVCACFAGLVDHDQAKTLEKLIGSLVVAKTIRIEPDYAAALKACPEGTLVCVSAGTGSVICSEGQGVIHKSGGGGYLLGDEGSGYRFGRESLRQYVRHPDEASSAVLTLISRYFEHASPASVIRSVYAARSPAPLVAAFAPAFAKDAQAMLPYATAFLNQEMEMLAACVLDHVGRFHPQVESAAIGLSGGLWKRAVFRSAFERAIHAASPTSVVRKSDAPPVRGAALLARESA